MFTGVIMEKQRRMLKKEKTGFRLPGGRGGGHYKLYFTAFGFFQFYLIFVFNNYLICI